MARLTTHVLDTASGKPAKGMRIQLRRAEASAVLADMFTNADGRPAQALLEGDAFKSGSYELRFHVGDYYRACGQLLTEPPFLDLLPVRVGLAEGRDYHVPLLISPYGYSTYRGS